MSPPLRLFVAGATGYTGRALVQVAREAGAVVFAHIRPDSPRLAGQRAAFEAQGAQVLACPWTPDALAEALEDARPTHVFCLIGSSAGSRKEAPGLGRADSYVQVDEALSRMLMKACQARSPRPHFLYLSSLGADRPRGAYLAARHAVETALAASGLDHSIARPSILTGDDRPEARPAELLSGRLVDGALGALAALGWESPQARLGPMTGETLARALLRLAEQAGPGRRIVEAPELRRLGAA
jgi:nucleoside-diphosphate-sugar epimerase